MCQKNDYTRRAVTAALAILTALLVFGVTLTEAQIATGGNYRLEQAVIGSGGGTSADSTGSVYKLESTIGEAVAGTTSSGTGYAVRGGFLSSAVAFAPTAAAVSVTGRIITPDGSGLRNVRVTLTDMHGTTRTVLSGLRGSFRFNEVASGETYIISVVSSRYQFAPQVVYVGEEIGDLTFAASGAAGGGILQQ